MPQRVPKTKSKSARRRPIIDHTPQEISDGEDVQFIARRYTPKRKRDEPESGWPSSSSSSRASTSRPSQGRSSDPSASSSFRPRLSPSVQPVDEATSSDDSDVAFIGQRQAAGSPDWPMGLSMFRGGAGEGNTTIPDDDDHLPILRPVHSSHRHTMRRSSRPVARIARATRPHESLPARRFGLVDSAASSSTSPLAQHLSTPSSSAQRAASSSSMTLPTISSQRAESTPSTVATTPASSTQITPVDKEKGIDLEMRED